MSQMIAALRPPRVSRPGDLTPRCACRSGPEGLPPGRHQRLPAPVKERRLLVAADLDQGQVGEARVVVLLRGGDDGVDVVPAGDAARDVLLTDELARRVERRRPGELGVDLPAEAEPAEERVRAGDGGGPVGVVADRELPDAGLAGPARGIEVLAQLRLR